MSTAKAKHQAQNQRQVNNVTPLISHAFAPVQNAAVASFLSLTTSYLYIVEGSFPNKVHVLLSGVCWKRRPGHCGLPPSQPCNPSALHPF